METNKSKYPLSIPFLCHIIVERQRFNKIRLTACQKRSSVLSDKVMRRSRGKDFEKLVKIEQAWDNLYEATKIQCKNYSKIISYVRKHIKAKIEWGTTSNVLSFTTVDGNRYKFSEMGKMSQSFVMDEMLFPELKVDLPHEIAEMENRFNALNHITKEFRKYVRDRYPAS